MDTPTPLTLAIHGGCLLVIALCLWLGSMLPDPLAAQMLTGAAFWLWGKLSFKPAAPVLDRIVAKLEPARVERLMSQRPPALAPADERHPTGAATPPDEVKP